MRIEQYFLMTDYLSWEVILNGDSPIPTRVVEGVLQLVAPTTAEQKIARKNELKARAIEKRFRGNTVTKKVHKTLLKQQKEHFTRECRSSKDSRRNGTAELQRRSVPRRSLQIMLLWPSHLRALLLIMRQKLEKAKQERDDLKLKLEKFQTSSKNLIELLASQKNEKTGLGYNSQVFTRAMFDCDDYLSSESDESWPPSSHYDRFQPSDGYHVVPPPYTGTFMPPKPDLVFNIALTTVETDHSAFNPEQDLSHINRPTTPIIKDWVSNSEDEYETKAPQIVPSFVQSTEQVKSPRHSIQ
nr:hypothetical protein [Tanacetum cinerariifolium]